MDGAIEGFSGGEGAGYAVDVKRTGGRMERSRGLLPFPAHGNAARAEEDRPGEVLEVQASFPPSSQRTGSGWATRWDEVAANA